MESIFGHPWWSTVTALCWPAASNKTLKQLTRKTDGFQGPSRCKACQKVEDNTTSFIGMQTGKTCLGVW